MSTYPVGTVASATVQGVPNVRVCRIRTTSQESECWYSADPIGGPDYHWHGDDIADIRPLVVLDLDEMALRGGWDSVAKLTDSLKRHGYATLATELVEQTKSPNIPEPEWASVVEAHTSGRTERRRFVGIGDSLWLAKHHNHHAPTYKWSDLINPTLVREGIES